MQSCTFKKCTETLAFAPDSIDFACCNASISSSRADCLADQTFECAGRSRLLFFPAFFFPALRQPPSIKVLHHVVTLVLEAESLTSPKSPARKAQSCSACSVQLSNGGGQVLQLRREAFFGLPSLQAPGTKREELFLLVCPCLHEGSLCGSLVRIFVRNVLRLRFHRCLICTLMGCECHWLQPALAD